MKGTRILLVCFYFGSELLLNMVPNN